jgi:VanZ family protein
MQPQLTPDFIVSSNHVYVFTIISLLGFVTYSKDKFFKIIIAYFFFIAVFLELAHIIIPERSFEVKDLGGNIFGVVVSLVIFLIFKLRKKNGLI